MRFSSALTAVAAVALLVAPSQGHAQSFTGSIGGLGFSNNVGYGSTATNSFWSNGDYFQQVFQGTGLSSVNSVGLELNFINSLYPSNGVSQTFTAYLNSSAVGTFTLTPSSPALTTLSFSGFTPVSNASDDYTLLVKQTGPSVPSGDGAVQLKFQGSSATLANGVISTPEPASLTLMATGLIGLGGVVRRRRKLA